MSTERKAGDNNSKVKKGDEMPDGSGHLDDLAIASVRASLAGSVPTLANSEAKETEERFLPCCDDPKLYLQILRGTAEYKERIGQTFIQAQARFASLAGQYPEEMAPTWEDAKAVFEDGQGFKSLFWDFEQDVLHLKYDPKKMPKGFNDSFAEYRVRVRASLEEIGKGEDAEAMKQKDLDRSVAHNEVAAVLVKEGIAETEFIARAIVRAFLIDVGEDYLQSARQADALRELRNLVDRRAIVKYLSQNRPDLNTIHVSAFSSERASVVADAFLNKHRESFAGDYPRSKAFDMPSRMSSRKGSGD